MEPSKWEMGEHRSQWAPAGIGIRNRPGVGGVGLGRPSSSLWIPQAPPAYLEDTQACPSVRHLMCKPSSPSSEVPALRRPVSFYPSVCWRVSG